jgi:hypothetical protein
MGMFDNGEAKTPEISVADRPASQAGQGMATRPGIIRKQGELAPTKSSGVVLVGRPGGLREEVANTFGTGNFPGATEVIAQVGHPRQFTDALRSVPKKLVLDGAAVVLVTEPSLPGLGTWLRYRHRARGLNAHYASLATWARESGASQLVVCSTAFLYTDDGGRPLKTSSLIEPRAETVAAYAAEQAAQVFTSLGGRSVILRLGWVFGHRDPITTRVVSAAAKGWQLIEGEPGSWVATISAADAARAAHVAITLAPGTYNVSDNRPLTQAAINAALEEAAGKRLHPLYDPDWGESSTLFGSSRRLARGHFGELTGWRPEGSGASEKDPSHWAFRTRAASPSFLGYLANRMRAEMGQGPLSGAGGG